MRYCVYNIAAAQFLLYENRSIFFPTYRAAEDAMFDCEDSQRPVLRLVSEHGYDWVVGLSGEHFLDSTIRKLAV